MINNDIYGIFQIAPILGNVRTLSVPLINEDAGPIIGQFIVRNIGLRKYETRIRRVCLWTVQRVQREGG